MTSNRILYVLAMAPFCTFLSCRKESPPVTPPPTTIVVDSCAYTEYPVTPLTQIFTTGKSFGKLHYSPANPNQLSFTRTGTGSNGTQSELGVYDFGSRTLLWSIPAESEYLDWGRNGKILFQKGIGIIGMVNDDGSGETVVETQGFAFNPKWSYSATRMIYMLYIGNQPYEIIADVNGNPLDTLHLYSGNYSLSATDDRLLYSSYVGYGAGNGNGVLGFRTQDLVTGEVDSLAVGTSAVLAEDLVWDSDGNRFYWRCNGVIYAGNMAAKTYQALTSGDCPGISVVRMAKHPTQPLFAVQKVYRKNQGPDTLYLNFSEYMYNTQTKYFTSFHIPLVE